MSDQQLLSHTSTFRVTRPKRSRNRPTVSCTACRARKQKCDRQQPCSGCQKRGLENSCRVEASQKSTDAGSAGIGDSKIQNELRQMRNVLQSLLSQPSQHQSAETCKGLLESVNRVEQTINEDAGQNGAISPAQHQSSDIIFGPVASVSIHDILTALPPRQPTDRLVSAYFNLKHIAVPFIHTHHFRRQYEAFWQNPAASDLLWISMLFSIMALGAVLDTTNRPPSAFHRSSAYVNMSSRCLVAGQYHKAKEFSVEALTLHLHSRCFHSENPDVDLSQLHALTVRLAQQQFYHHEINQFIQIVTPFEAEMRRRVWYFVQYYDVLFSLEHGLPPLIYDNTCSAGPPTNATDDNFDEDSSIILPRSISEEQSTLPCVFMSQLLPILRQIICHALGSTTCSYSDTMQLKAQLEAWYRSIPACLRIRSIRDTAFTDSTHTIMQRILLELIYITSITLLYRPFLDPMTYTGREFQTALDICRQNAVRSVRVYVEVDREMQKGGRLYGDQHIASSLLVNDFLIMTIVRPLEFFECVDLP